MMYAVNLHVNIGQRLWRQGITRVATIKWWHMEVHAMGVMKLVKARLNGYGHGHGHGHHRHGHVVIRQH